MNNVVTLKRGATSYVVDEQVMDTLRVRMYAYDPAELALHMCVSKSCIYALRSGRTKWPRGATFFALIRYIDIELHLFDVRTKRYL